jgi:hypothetical protein
VTAVTASRVVAFALGAAVVLSTLHGAVRTFVLPRSAHDGVTRFFFDTVRRVFEWRARRAGDYLARDAIMALYAPITLVGIVFFWMILVGTGFVGIFWALGSPLRQAVMLSGSSLLTLGFERPTSTAAELAAFGAAAVGLTFVALLVAYLPTMYTAFARRESAVTMLEVRAGSPPTPETLLLREHRLGSLDRLDEYWRDWQLWFVELEESHTSLAALAFFRSPRPNRSWVTAAGAVLDTVSLSSAALERGPTHDERLCLRAGAFALQRIAEFFRLRVDLATPPSGAISVRRAEFDAVLERLAAEGVSLRADRDAAWAEFCAARAYYDQVLLALAAFTMAPEAPWSSDRAPVSWMSEGRGV